MKRFVWMFSLVLATCSLISGAAVALRPPGLLCFSGAPATCIVTSPTSADLDTSAGGYAGVYRPGKPRAIPVLAFAFSFDYSCPGAPCVGGGSPRWSIPIDTDVNGTTDGYAFVDAQNCGQTGLSGTVDTSCPVFFLDGVYGNWTAFGAAHPGYRIPPRGIPFAIADQPFNGTLSNVAF